MRLPLSAFAVFVLLAAPARAAEQKSIPEIPEQAAAPALSPTVAAPQLAVPTLEVGAPLALPQAQASALPEAAAQTASAPAKASAQAQIQQASSSAQRVQAALSPSRGDTSEAKASAGRDFDLTRPPTPGSEEALLAPQSGPSHSGLQPYAPRSPPEKSGGYARDAGLPSMLDEAVERGDLSPEQRGEWEQTAYIDPLTGMRNRLYLDDHVAKLVANHKSLETLKLDFLKEINDRYDHETGNKVLTALAAVSRKVAGNDAELVRRSPTGVAVFIDAPAKRARYVAEALRVAVEEKMGNLDGLVPGPVPKDIGGTINVGVAAITRKPTPKEEYAAAYDDADAARKFAKDAGGGNRVAVHDGGPRLMDRLTAGETILQLTADFPELAQRLAHLPHEELAAVMAQAQARRALRARDLLAKVSNPSLHQALFDVVYLDRLSGLLNRRWLFDSIDTLMGPGGYTHYTALDLDKFGTINERFGEDKADLVLKEFGHLLGEAARAEGAVALHLSGEEFVLLSRDVDARALADRVRLKVRAELGRRAALLGIVDGATGAPLTLTASFGVGEIKPGEGAPDHVLTLATAMAEAMLHRAKENGRDRVEAPADLEAILRKVLRMDETARRAISKVLALAKVEPPTDALFNNAYRPRREVLAALTYNPGWQRGTLLSELEKGGSEVYRINPPGRPSRVIKIAPEETVASELFGRSLLRSFEIFNESLFSADATAYSRWPFLRPMLVMEDLGQTKKDGLLDSDSLPLSQKRALALFALTFGFHGFNGKAYVDVGWRRTGLVDFEFGRALIEPNNNPNRIGSMGDMPWVSEFYLNDLSDYHDAIEQWRRIFKRPEVQKDIEGMLRRAGVSEKRIAQDLKTFAANAARLEENLAADIVAANRLFRASARRAGLDDAQSEALSAINKAAHVAPEASVTRDVVRFLNRRAGEFFLAKPGFELSAEEFHRLAVKRQRGLLPDDKKSVMRAAEAGRLGPYPASAVRRALEELHRALPPARS